MFQHRSLTEYCNAGSSGSETQPPQFHASIGSYATDESNIDKMCQWDCIWSTTLNSPLRIMRFSPDGAFFATNGKDDNLVKIWYQEISPESDGQPNVSYNFVYLDHPKAVIGIEWRRPGRHMPRGFFVNALITWCEDRVCRLWRETVASIESDFLNSFRSTEKPVDSTYVDAESQKKSQLKTARLKIRNRLKKFSLGAEKILAEALKSDAVNGQLMSPANQDSVESKDTVFQPPSDPSHADSNSTGSIRDNLDVKIELLLREWQQSSDVLFAVHPLDGSLLIWSVSFLDNGNTMAQTCLTSRLPGVFPMTDAASMCSNLAVLNPRDPLYVEVLQKDMYSALDTADLMQNHDIYYGLSNCIFLLTTHKNGTLNLWHINVDGKSKFCQMLSVTHKSRMCGHRFIVNSVACSPVLPLFLTTSHHNVGNKKYNLMHTTETLVDSAQHNIQRFSSELILWKVNPVGPLRKEGGVEELARINSLELSAFSRVAWVPTVLPSFSLGNNSNSPSSCFVASNGNCLRTFQAVLDARSLLTAAKLNSIKRFEMESPDSNFSGASSRTPSAHDEPIPFQPNIVSSQSTAQPGCIIELDVISDSTQVF
ncbi:unnamed protein product [Soboliphyme baturini]|uniref:WD_REPEATS_REGION domain-containing protein n=1 Tax=Soboliphyme baturini TaxID=241478 RepID=A0A183IVZ3_9BILA|nr:unnamed protein product [Soboliphyme baturini]